MANVFAFVACATVELAVRDGLVTFDAGCKGWLPLPALAPLATLAALAAYAPRLCGPDCGLRRSTKVSSLCSTHALITPTIPAWQ
jgi:hypothetical protein